jgi:hypothetical protein
MKSKRLLSISTLLFSFAFAGAQTNINSGKREPDSLNTLSFRILVKFISSDTLTTHISETEKNSISHLGEQHQLITPVQTYPGSAADMAKNSHFGYDNFLPSVYNKEATQGSPFLLPVYVPGLVINPSYGVVNTSDYLYNYDKMSGNLLLKRNNEQPIAVNRGQVKMFCLKLDKGGYIFSQVPLINDNEFFQVIYKGPKYSSYKLYKNKFINSNQKTNGYSTDGKSYDEYQDIETFYIVDERKGEWAIYELSKKSIKKALNAESVAVDQYLKEHKYDDITESWMAQLLESLNK